VTSGVGGSGSRRESSMGGNQYCTRENNLTLWTSWANKRLGSAGSFVHTFYGHNDMITDYHWVQTLGDVANCWKLVTWSKDNTLKLWPISENLLEMSGYDDEFLDFPAVYSDQSDVGDLTSTMSTGYSSEDVSKSEDFSFDLSSEGVSLMASESKMAPAPVTATPPIATPTANSRKSGASAVRIIPTLNQEFTSVKFGDRVSIETLDTSRTSGEPYAVVIGETTTQRVYFQVKFPSGYALLQEPPRFSMITGTTLDQATGFRIQHKVQKEAERLTLAGERCLEACFRLFVQEIDEIFRQEKEELSSEAKAKKLLTGNDAVPFPRTSGARFCGLGQLVCFGWSYSVKVEDVSPHHGGGGGGSNSAGSSSKTGGGGGSGRRGSGGGGAGSSAAGRINKDSQVPSRVAKTPRALSALSDSTILMNSEHEQQQQQQKLSTAAAAVNHNISVAASGDGKSGNSGGGVGWKPRKEAFQINVRGSSKVSFDPRFISSAKVENEKSSMLSQFLHYKNRFSQLENSDAEEADDVSAKGEGANDVTGKVTRKFVTVYDTLPMLSFSRDLAAEYRICAGGSTGFGGEIESLRDVCRHNSRVAVKYHRFKAARSWQLAAQCCEGTSLLEPHFLFGQRSVFYPNPVRVTSCQQTLQNNQRALVSVVRDLIKRHASSDLQTAAMLCCVFAKATVANVSGDGGHDNAAGVNAFATAAAANGHAYNKITKTHGDTKSESRVVRRGRNASSRRKNRSECLAESNNSALESASSDFGGIKNLFAQAESLAELLKHWEQLDKDGGEVIGGEVEVAASEECVLDKSLSNLYDAYRLFYAEMLRRCGLLIQAVEVSHLTLNNPNLTGGTKVELVYLCPKCGDSSRSVYCSKCRSAVGPRCVHCGLVVKGQASVCLECGHGGHLIHMMEWFENNDQELCASSGCRCPCLAINSFD